MTERSPPSDLLMPSTYLNVILRALDPAQAQQVIAEAGLPHSETDDLKDVVSLGQMQSAIAGLRGRVGQDWHLQLIHRLNLFAHGSLGVAAATAPNMDSAISVLERYIAVRAPFVRLVRRVENHRCTITVLDEGDLGERWRDMLETAMLGIQSLLEQVHGAPLDGTHMAFAFPAPAYVDGLKARIQGRALFDAAEHSIELPVQWLAQSSPMHDAAMHRAALSRVETELEAMSSQLSLVNLVRRALLAEPESVPGLQEIARSQNIAPRTLIRRLKKQGSSYHEILQEIRKQRAIELLSDGNLTVKEVSYLLGYHDPSNFGRAFAQWTGQSPGSYRKGLPGKS